VWVVEDLKSSNGTFVNNERIEKQELNEGDELRCGDFCMTYLVEDKTREVGDIEMKESKSPDAAKSPPRLVGSLSKSKKPKPPPDPAIIERPTIGLQESIDLSDKDAIPEPAFLKNAGLQADKHEEELASARDEITGLEGNIARLRSELDELQTTSGDQAKQIETLESELADAKRNNSQTALDPDDEFVDTLAEIYEDLDTFTSEIKLKLKLSSGLIADLEPVIALMESLRTEKLPKVHADKIRSVVEDTDAGDTLANVQSTFAEAERSARATRRMVRLFREVLAQKTGK